jgi:hypothetical protein
MNDIATAARRTQTAARPWVVRLARLGYAAKGVVYLLVGWLALRAAFGNGQTTGSEGALVYLRDQPFGKLLLLVLAFGLLGYAIWRAVQAIADPEGKGNDPKGLAARGYMAASAVAHGALFLAALRLASGGGSGGDATKTWTARLMAQPAGRWLVAAVGVAVIAGACQQLWTAFGERYRRHVRLDLLDPTVARWVGPVARLGLVSRAVVFFVVGGFLFAAALHSRPDEARGLGEALGTLAQQPAGTALLLAVALGLVAYGLYELVKARYRVIALPTSAAWGYGPTGDQVTRAR